MSKIQNNESEENLTLFKKLSSYFIRNQVKFYFTFIILGIIFNLFLYLFTPILMPIESYGNKYDTSIQSDEYFTEELRSNPPIISNVELLIFCESNEMINLYVFTLFQYSIYQTIKSVSGDLSDIDSLFTDTFFQSQMNSIDLGFRDIYNDPIYIVIDPNNHYVSILISYELRITEKVWYFTSFFLLVFEFCLISYLLFKNYKNNPWNEFHNFIKESGEKLFKKGFFDKSISAVSNEIETLLQNISNKYSREEITRNQSELYGVTLIDSLFNENDPVIISNENNKKQRDDKKFFISCFKLFRNPFAHKNITLRKRECLRKLMFLDEMLKMFNNCYIRDENNNIKIFELPQEEK